MRIRRLLLLIFVAVLCTAGLILVFTMHDGSAGTGTAGAVGIRINEVMTSNKGTVSDGNGNFPDWFELYNTSDKDVDISGFGLSDDKLAAAKWAFPSGTVVPAHGYLVVYCSGDAEKGSMHAAFKLSAQDALILSNSSGHVVDSIQLRSVASGAVLAFDDATGAWQELSYPSPGFPNTEEGAAQYRETLKVNVTDNGIRINEFMASNATTLPGKAGDYPDWLELYNTTDKDVDISGCGLSDDVNQPMKWAFPSGTVVPAKSFLLVCCSGRDGYIDEEWNVPFSLRAYEESVVFSSAQGGIIDSFTYPQQEADLSMAREPDGTGEWKSTSRPTPGYPNTDEGFAAFSNTSALPKGAVMLSEAMASNAGSYAAGNTTPDWIELYNSSSEPVNLLNYALSDNPSNPSLWKFPDTTINPGEYLVVLATGADVKDTQKKRWKPTSPSLRPESLYCCSRPTESCWTSCCCPTRVRISVMAAPAASCCITLPRVPG